MSSCRISLAARRAERQPDRQLLLPRRRARQQQVRDVGADDQEDQRDDDAEDGDRAKVVRVDVVDAARARLDAQARNLGAVLVARVPALFVRQRFQVRIHAAARRLAGTPLRDCPALARRSTPGFSRPMTCSHQ